MPRKEIKQKAPEKKPLKGTIRLTKPKKEKLEELPLSLLVIFRAMAVSLANIESLEFDKQYFSFIERLIDLTNEFRNRDQKSRLPEIEEALARDLEALFEREYKTAELKEELAARERDITDILVSNHVPTPFAEKTKYVLAHLSPGLLQSPIEEELCDGGTKEKAMLLAGVLMGRKRDIRSKHGQKSNLKANRFLRSNFSLGQRYDSIYLQAKYRLLFALDIPSSALKLIIKDDQLRAKSPEEKRRAFTRAVWKQKSGA